MTAVFCVVILTLVGFARADIVELNCSDNSTCINRMTRELVRSLREHKTVRLFDMLTIEPRMRQARSGDGPFSTFLQNHAFLFDWENWSFRLAKSEKKDAMEIDVFESKTAKDILEASPKNVNGKEREDEAKSTPKRKKIKTKKVLQAVVPLVFGMKTAGVATLAMAVVTVMTLKAYFASKIALAVTVGMAAKKLYESYGNGVGLQNNPYLYSQYPIDFPSASSHAYSVNGASPQFGTPELYSPTGIASQHIHEFHDGNAQQSQQVSTLQLANGTAATERWDGKSFIRKIMDGLRNAVSPLTTVFYGVMPATYRGLTSEVTTLRDTSGTEPLSVEEIIVKPKQILVPQPRNIAQRKMSYRKPISYRPKKYTALKVDLDRLKNNKELLDYIRTKKYKFNYPTTYFYPRVKNYVDPNSFLRTNLNNRRLTPHQRESNFSSNLLSSPEIILYNSSTEWKPIAVLTFNTTYPQITHNQNIFNLYNNTRSSTRVKRIKRSIDFDESGDLHKYRNRSMSIRARESVTKSGGLVEVIDSFFGGNLFESVLTRVQKYTKTMFKQQMTNKTPPIYYVWTYNILMATFEIFDGISEVQDTVIDYFHESPSNVKKDKEANNDQNKEANKTAKYSGKKVKKHRKNKKKTNAEKNQLISELL